MQLTIASEEVMAEQARLLPYASTIRGNRHTAEKRNHRYYYHNRRLQIVFIEYRGSRS
ncbi:hypothetical protein NUACC26_021910 [Scytonema sp. NUACC26]